MPNLQNKNHDTWAKRDPLHKPFTPQTIQVANNILFEPVFVIVYKRCRYFFLNFVHGAL